jgi:hypothetical protein
VSANVIFKINYYSDTFYEKCLVAKGCRFSLHALKFIGVSDTIIITIIGKMDLLEIGWGGVDWIGLA